MTCKPTGRPDGQHQSVARRSHRGKTFVELASECISCSPIPQHSLDVANTLLAFVRLVHRHTSTLPSKFMRSSYARHVLNNFCSATIAERKAGHHSLRRLSPGQESRQNRCISVAPVNTKIIHNVFATAVPEIVTIAACAFGTATCDINRLTSSQYAQLTYTRSRRPVDAPFRPQA
jgi:hypothetical protein